MKRYKTIYSRFEVKTAVLQLANRVYNLIENRGAENCVYLTVLEGGAFLSHKILDKLAHDMLMELTTANIKVSSYSGDKQGELIYNYMPNVDCTGKTVIIVDDFCDSGSTTRNLEKIYLERFGAKEVVFVTLLARARRELNQTTKLIFGIEDSSDLFFVGCGLDDNGKARFVDSIMAIETDEEQKG
jgi:hypoxanthine-guanine phosphoribosyltransferase